MKMSRLYRASLLFGLAFSASASGASAQNIPNYNIEAICKGEAPEIAAHFARSKTPTEAQTAAAFKSCIQAEQEELAELRAAWPKLSSRVKSYCIKAMGGPVWEDKDYASLLLCTKHDKPPPPAKKKSG
jgi:hypothetical protein